jgi:hypothetical protein
VQTLRQSNSIQPPSTTRIDVQANFVGSRVTAETVTLDSVHWQCGDPNSRENTLLKIDVEGKELDVLRGAFSWLRPSNLFIIEVHTAALLPSIIELFSSYGLHLEKINQRPLPVLGREHRDVENWWLVSALSNPP